MSVISTDYAHMATAEYIASYATLNGSYPLSGLTQIFKNKIRTNADIVSASSNNSTMTFTLQSSTQGQTARATIRVTPYRHIFGNEA